ncbi:MAG: histidine phosphatase family protein [Chloroflexota bacterium]
MSDGPPLVPEGLDATLVLLRHGESEWIRENRFQGQAETPLSAVGRRQASLAAERLARPHASPALPVPLGRPIEIVHSPLARTRATAEAVGTAIASEPEGAAIPVRPEPGIMEIGQGEWEGVTHDEIMRRWPAELSAWRRRPHEAWAPGGESIAQVQARVRPALAGVLERLGRGYPRGSLDRPQVGGYPGVGPGAGQPWSILVGHDGVFKILLLTLFDLPLDRFWMFTFALCGITVVEFRGGRAVLRAHNLTEHLASLLDERAQEDAERRARSGAL